MSWRTELEKTIAAIPPDEIPDLLAELVRIVMRMLMRPAPPENVAHGPDDRSNPFPLMTVERVAVALSVDERWVYRHADELGAIRLSEKCLRFPRDTVDAYLRSRCASNGHDIASIPRR